MEDLIANMKNHPLLAVLALVTVLFAGFRIMNPGASHSLARGSSDQQEVHRPDGHWYSPRAAFPWEDRIVRDPFAVIEPVIPVQAEDAHLTVGKTDPSSVISVPEIPDFELTTIMQGKHTIAVINGRSVIAGMSIEHWVVLDIDTDQVKLERDGVCILLTVSGESHAEVPVE